LAGAARGTSHHTPNNIAHANGQQNIKEGIEGKPVTWYSDVFKIVFPNVDRDAANKLWDKDLKPKKGDRKRKEQKRKEEEEEESGEDDD
jgi:Lon-like ATP-dependent protease